MILCKIVSIDFFASPYTILELSLKKSGFSIPEYGSTTIETIELTKEKERKEREKEFKKNFDMVELDGGSWKIDVPRRKNK